MYVKYIANLGQVDLTKGKWLILTRTKSQLLELMNEVRKKKIYIIKVEEKVTKLDYTKQLNYIQTGLKKVEF